MPIDEYLGYDPATGAIPGDPTGVTGVGGPFGGNYGPTTNQLVDYYTQNPDVFAGTPQGSQVLGALGYDPAAYDYERARLESEVALNKYLMDIAGSMGGGGGAVRNPFLDQLEREGITADRSYLDVQSQLAGKGLELSNLLNTLQSQGYDVQKAQALLNLKGLDISQAGLQDQLGILRDLTGLQLGGVNLERQDIQSAIRQLGLDRQGLGLQNRGLDFVLQQLGLNRGAAQQSAETQLRNLLYDATARGAGTSQGLREDRTDVRSNLERALGQIGIQEGQVGLQREDLGLQGQRLGEREGGYNRELERLGLKESQIRLQEGAQTRDIDRQLKQLGLDRESLGMTVKDFDRLKEILGVQRQQTGQQTYGEMARINNALEHLRLQEAGIGVAPSVGGGGSSNPAGLQGLAGLLRAQSDIDLLGQQQAGALSQALGSLSSNPALANQLFGQAFGTGYNNPSTSYTPVSGRPNQAATEYNYYNDRLIQSQGGKPSSLPPSSSLNPLSPFYGWENRMS